MFLSHQIERLKEANVSLTLLADALGLVGKLPNSKEIQSRWSHIPLILVIPLTAMPLESQLKVVMYRPSGSSRDFHPAYSFLNSQTLVPAKVSERPYILMDVENGSETLGESPNIARTRIRLNGRQAFNVEQCLALAVHYPKTFDSHNIHASDSSMIIGGRDYTPDFWVYGGKIKMKRDDAGDSDFRWGTPSYGQVITVE